MKAINQSFHKIIAMPKGISSLISAVMVILISVVGIAVVLSIGLPLIDRFGDAALVGEANRNILALDNLIREAASESVGVVKGAQLDVNGGVYRVNTEAGSLDFDTVLKSDIISKGTFRKEGNLRTSVVGSASATQNSTHLKIANEILEVVFNRTGNSTSFDGINTSSIIRSIVLKDSSTTLVPIDTSITVGGVRNSSWGLGYSGLVREGEVLPQAEVRAHVRSNLTNTEYDVFYSLPASSDFMLVSVRNVTSTNKTAITLTYKLGSTGSGGDVIKIGNVNETTFTS